METFNNKAIGVMDSGVGGLTILEQLKKACPNENYIYYGDTKNLPYGEKTKDELISIVKEIFDFFETQNVKAVVLACNTTSATAYEELKNDYSFKIYPLIQVISKCIGQDKSIQKIGVMATQATVNSKKYTEELKKNNANISVYEQACPKLVPIVENQLTDCNKQSIIKNYIEPILKFEPQKIILGCTHYPYLLEDLSQFAPKELFINPAELFAKEVKKDLEERCLLANNAKGSTEYYASSNIDEFNKNAKTFMMLDKQPKLIKL